MHISVSRPNVPTLNARLLSVLQYMMVIQVWQWFKCDSDSSRTVFPHLNSVTCIHQSMGCESWQHSLDAYVAYVDSLFSCYLDVKIGFTNYCCLTVLAWLLILLLTVHVFSHCEHAYWLFSWLSKLSHTVRMLTDCFPDCPSYLIL